MTTTTTIKQPGSAPWIARALSGIGAKIVSAMEVIAHSSDGMRRARYAEQLFELSDAELAKRGLTRDRIIQHAFVGYI